MKMRIKYEEHDDFWTRDKLFKLHINDQRIQIGVKYDLCRNNDQWQESLHGARRCLLEELGKILFGEGW